MDPHLPRIRIVTDSVADLPEELIQRWEIKRVPVYLNVDGRSYRDDGTLSHAWFYRQLIAGTPLMQTAAPAIGEFASCYRELVEEGAQEILGLFVASSLSSLAGHGRQAAEAFSAARVRVVESRQVSMGIGWQVIAAAEALAAGASMEDVVALVESLRERTYVFGVLDSLDHLLRSGRVNWTQARVAKVLRIKPVIAFYGGEAHLLGQVRTRRRALKWLFRRVEEAAPLERLALLHSHLDVAALEEVRILLEPLAPPAGMLTVEVGPVFGTHIGPGGVGVALVQSSEAPPLYRVLD
ncbi:MAG: DegV family protein [Anaerolineales bacterium]